VEVQQFRDLFTIFQCKPDDAGFMPVGRVLGAIGVGMFVTCVLQSSAASLGIVLSIAMSAPELMNFETAVPIVLGSNIGTTTTAWIIAFVPDVGLLGLSVVAIGAVFYFFINRETAHNLGLALMGLGFVFMGLYWMNKGVAPIKENESIRAVFASLDAGTVMGLAKCFLISLVFTAVVQSSAATTAIAMTLSIQGIISFETAAATVFGMNIGTTVTAWLAAFGGTTEAKRTAMAHTLFNVVGTAVLIPLFIPVMLPVTKELFPDWAAKPAAPMAAIHTGFNIVTTLIFLPFVKQFARFVTWLVPAKAQAEQTRLTYLSKRVKQSPQIACEQAAREVLFMANSNIEMMANVKGAIEGTADDKDIDHVFRREDILDRVQQEVTEFLGRVMTSRLPEDVAGQARSLLRVTDELETVSDEECTVIKALKRFRDGGGELSGEARSVVLDIHSRVAALASAVNTALESCESDFCNRQVDNADGLSEDIRMRVREARQSAIGNTGDSPMRTLAQLDILNAFDRMRSCYLNISQTLAGGKHV
jgi:phosphate:Na+ symporter